MVDHIFKAYDIRGKVGSELSTDLVCDIGRAFADWLPTEGIVAVGRDMRPDSAELSQALIQGLTQQGRTVWDLGQITSDMAYFAVGKYDLAGAAVVTASHNPGAYNGIKLYRDKVTPVGLESGLAQVRDQALKKTFKDSSEQGKVEPKNINTEWVAHTLGFVDPTAWPPYRIAIDAGNGMAGAILPKILPQLPLTVERMYFELDGTFPNHEANPQKIENLQALISKIQENNYDFGIAFDGDGDRAALVDDQGRPVLGSDVISLVAAYMLQQHPGASIVYDVRTSRATQELIAEWGGKPVRAKAGRVHIGAKAREVGAPFGGETTGHLFFKDNYDADSGLIAALVAIQALSQTGKKLSAVIDEYRRYAMAPEMNFEVADTQVALRQLTKAFADGKQDTLDGLTVNYATWWFNARASNTEPVLRLNVEAVTQSELNEAIDRLQKIIKEQ